MAGRFNHAFTIAFSVVSDRKDGEDVTPATLRAALQRRLDELDRSPDREREWREAVGAPFDTFEED